MLTDQAIRVSVPQPDDAAAIARLQKQTWRATYPSPAHGVSEADINAVTEGWDSPDGVARIRGRIINPPRGSHRLVAKDGERVVGHCIVRRGETRNGLRLLYVLPEYQSRGVGRLLAHEALSWLGSDKDITLEVAQYNAKAVRFYERLGFKIVGEAQDEMAKLPSGAMIPEWEMVRTPR